MILKYKLKEKEKQNIHNKCFTCFFINSKQCLDPKRCYKTKEEKPKQLNLFQND